MTRKNKTVYVYVVQNHEQQVEGVFSSLKLALDSYVNAAERSLTQEDIQFLQQEFGENFHDAMEYPPCIVVHQLDGVEVWSYDSIVQVRNAVESGEDFTLYEE